MNVNIGGDATPDTLAWGSAPADVGTKIVGTLKFGSTTAAAATTFRNSIALGSADRTIQVDDNPNSTATTPRSRAAFPARRASSRPARGVLKLTGANTYSGHDDHRRRRFAGHDRRRAGFRRTASSALNGGVLQFLDTATFTRGLGTQRRGVPVGARRRRFFGRRVR